MNNRGSVILQLLFYMSIVTLITTISLTLATSFYKSLKDGDHQIENLYDACVILRYIIKDLKQASIDKDSWKKIEPNYFIAQVNGSDVGWKINKNKLYRITGQYNKSLNRWSKRAASLVSCNCKEFQLKFVKSEKKYSAVHFSLFIKNIKKPFKVYIRFKVGTFV